MDEYGQIGPEKGEYQADVRNVARKLLRGPVAVTLTHRMTAMRLVLVWEHDCAQSGAVLELGGIIPKLFVAVSGCGAYWFNLGGFIAPSYLAEKLGITHADAETVSEFLSMVDVGSLHRGSIPKEEVVASGDGE